MVDPLRGLFIKVPKKFFKKVGDFHGVKTTIIQNLKFKIQNYLYALFLLVAFSFPMSPLPAQTNDPDQVEENLQKNRKDLEEIRRKLKEEEKKKREARARERNVLNRLDRLDRKLTGLEREKAANRRDLSETRSRIDRLQAEMADNQVRLRESRGLLRKRLRALYRLSFRRPLLGGILESGSFGDWARRMKFEQILAENNRKLLARTERQEGRLEQDSAQWAKEEKRKQRILSALSNQERKVSSERRTRATFLASLRKEQALRERTIQDLNDAANELQRKVAALLKQVEGAKGTPSGPYKGPGLLGSRGALPWPVQGPLISKFGRHKNTEFNTILENNGIQIRSSTGTPIRAVAGGLVRYSDWFKGFGKLVILDHGRGYYSLYAQASDLSVAAGEEVAAGQVLGAVGDTGSLVGESLYFEIRRDGIPQDPLKWLK